VLILPVGGDEAVILARQLGAYGAMVGAAGRDVGRKFLAELMDHRELRGLLSDEHFSIDGTQIGRGRR
jgi:hypothetical protein